MQCNGDVNTIDNNDKTIDSSSDHTDATEKLKSFQSVDELNGHSDNTENSVEDDRGDSRES